MMTAIASTGLRIVNPRNLRHNPPKLIRPMTGAKLWSFMKDKATDDYGGADPYVRWLWNEKEQLIPVINDVLRAHYQARAELEPRTRKQRENDVAGSIDSAHKTGKGDDRRVYLIEEERALVGVREDQRQESKGWAYGRGYVYLNRLDDAQLATLWGFYEGPWRRRTKTTEKRREAREEKGTVEAEYLLPPGPWSQQLEAVSQRQVRSFLEKKGALDQLDTLWPHARIYHEEWKGTWEQAFIAAWSEAQQEVLDAIEEDPDEADFLLEHTPEGGTILHIQTAQRLPKDDYKAIVQGNGFKWSRREGFAFRVRSRGRRKPTTNIRNVIHDITAKGYTVAYVPPVDLSLDTAIAAARAAAEQTAEHHRARAAKKYAEAGAGAEAARLQAEEAIRSAVIPGFFPTPPALARQLVELADVQAGDVILEPSAGHGAIAEIIQSKGVTPDTIEVNKQLRDILVGKGFPVVASDVFDASFDPGTLYDAVIMNPPFEEGAALAHVEHAYRYVAPGGRLVAIMPESIMYREDKKHEAFSAWLDAHDAEIIDVPRQKFGNAEVKTRIVVIDKPEDAPHRGPTGATQRAIEAARERVRVERPDIAERLLPPSGWYTSASKARKARTAYRKAERAQRAAQKARETKEYAQALERRAAAVERRGRRAVQRRDVTTEAQTVRIPEALWRYLDTYNDDPESDAAEAWMTAQWRSGDRGSRLYTWTTSLASSLDHTIGSDMGTGIGVALLTLDDMDYTAKEKAAIKRAATSVHDQIAQLTP